MQSEPNRSGFFKRFLLVAFVFVTLLPQVGGAQQNPSGVYILGQDRLFGQSEFGLRVRATIDARNAALGDENQRMAGDLEAEELALTEQRPTLSAAEFRELADVFDAKVEAIRTGQAQKNVELARWAEDEQKRFFEAAIPVIVQMFEEIGAVAFLDERSVIISAERIDITAAAITRVNEAIGDGALEEPVPDQPAPEE